MHGKQGSEELPKEAKGRKDTEKDQVPEPEGQLEEQPALEVVEQVRPRSWWGVWRGGSGGLTVCRAVVGMVGAAMSSVAVGSGDVRLTVSSASLGDCVRAQGLLSQASPYSMDDRDPRKFMSGESWGLGSEAWGGPRMPWLSVPIPRLHWLCAPRPLPLRLQLSCAQQPGTAGIWAEALTRQCPEGPQISPPTSQDIPSEPGSFT